MTRYAKIISKSKEKQEVLGKEKEEEEEEEKTQIVSEVENALRLSLQCFARVKERHDSCGDDTLPSVIVTTESIKNAYRELLRRGIKTRFITEITEENIEYCKELRKIVHELRHLGGVKGNFGVSESDYVATAIQHESHPISQLTHSNSRHMIEQQQRLFESLWNKAVSAEQRIRKIEEEEGTKREVTETIRDSHEIQKLVFDLVRSAKVEVLMIFSAASTFHLQARVGVLQLLEEVAARGIRVRILLPLDNKIIREMTRLTKGIGVEIRDNKKPLQAKAMILVVDNASSLTVEIKDDSKETLEEEAIGLAIYSNSESTLLAYASIFEMIWMESELRYHGNNRKEPQQE
jgi:two-component system, OmpR family, sensor histidine kinase VicK